MSWLCFLKWLHSLFAIDDTDKDWSGCNHDMRWLEISMNTFTAGENLWQVALQKSILTVLQHCSYEVICVTHVSAPLSFILLAMWRTLLHLEYSSGCINRSLALCLSDTHKHHPYIMALQFFSDLCWRHGVKRLPLWANLVTWRSSEGDSLVSGSVHMWFSHLHVASADDRFLSPVTMMCEDMR